ncbi:MAG TPA: Gfo/Idh/MocA family oxidoreductase, partial [Acidobacteriota bacterium]
ERIEARYPGVKTTIVAEEAIADPEAEAIVIVTPLSTHYRLARLALEEGKDVLVEKPLATTVQDCQHLIELAQKKEKILMVGHVFIFNPGVQHVKRVLENHEIGKIISMHSIRTNLGPVRFDANALWDLGSHDLSIFNYWLQEQPRTVTASGICHLSKEREDTVVASYVYPQNVIATLLVSWLHPRKVREITIVGEEKMVVWNDMDLNEPIRIYDKGVERDEGFADSFGAFRLTLREGNIIAPLVRGMEPLAAECDHFIECVLKRLRPISDGTDGLAVVRELVAADESIRNNNKTVDVS